MKNIKLYQEQLLDHYHHPRHKGIVENPDFTSDQVNPSCGDMIGFQGKIEDNRLTEVAFDGKGCILSLAAASMLAEFAKDKPITQILAYNKETMHEMINLALGPTRQQCILLPLQALQSGIKNYLESAHA